MAQCVCPCVCEHVRACTAFVFACLYGRVHVCVCVCVCVNSITVVFSAAVLVGRCVFGVFQMLLLAC